MGHTGRTSEGVPDTTNRGKGTGMQEGHTPPCVGCPSEYGPGEADAQAKAGQGEQAEARGRKKGAVGGGHQQHF